jgi:arsenate reductase (glutaredoxin)
MKDASVTIYHKPNCSTSKDVLAMIRERGIEPEVVQYLKTPPSRETLRKLAADAGTTVRGLLRQRGTPYDELGLGEDKWSDEQLLDFMQEHPILMERPIVVTPKGTRICRPKDSVYEILP